MKKLLAMIMVVAMLAAFVPATLATEAKEVESFDKSQFTKTVEAPKLYGIDNNGNKIASGSTMRATAKTDLSGVNTPAKTATKAATKGFADSPHYGVGMIDPSQSLGMSVGFENSDFNGANDFFTDKTKSYSLLISPTNGGVEDSDVIDKAGLRRFNNGEKFWFNFDLVSGWDSQGSPVYFTDKDGNKALIPFTVYMYSGTSAQWNAEVGVQSLKLCAAWDGYTRVSQAITVPAANMVYVFAIVVSDSTVQDMGIRGFQGQLQMSEHDRDYRDLKSTETIEVGKSYTADLGSSSSDMTLLYGDDIGLVLANAKAYKVNLKGGQQLAIRAEGDGHIGGRVFFMDENMDIITGNFLGTGAVTGSDDYKYLTWAVFPPVDGDYYIVIAGFFYEDEGKMDFELVEYEEARKTSSETLPQLPDCSNVDIDVETLGTEAFVETIDGMDVWGYAYESTVSMGILTIAYPGTFHITGSNPNCLFDIYDGVVLDLNNATVAATICNGTWAPITINSTGKSSIVDSFYSVALLNYPGYYSSVYITGDELEVVGEMAGGIQLQVPTHVYAKKLTASAKKLTGYFAVAMWTEGWNAPKLTFGKNAKFVDATGSTLRVASMYWDADNYYRFGYTISESATLQRYNGATDFYNMADYFTATTEGNPNGGGSSDNDDTLRGDANCDGIVNTGDAVTVLKHAAGMLTLEGQAFKNADYNGDTLVNTGDAVGILKKAAGME